VRVVHDRHIGAVLGDWPLLVSQFRDVLILLILLNVAVWVLPPWDWGAPFVSNLSLSTWMMLLPISLLAVFVQISAEEVLFRGYLQQQLAARFSSPLVWMVLPAVVFGWGHYLPESDGVVAGPVALWAVVFGILMADLTARAGTLGPAIAVHLVNNVSAMMLVSLPDGFSGLALYLAPFSMEDTDMILAWLPVDFVFMIVSWLAARLAIRR
jgi:membrane protease YdiL (CAAX protease family)